LEPATRNDAVTEKNPPSIEQAMERLEKLVGEMESGQLPLDKLIAGYEEGVKLVRLCQEKLDAAEQRIQIITRNATGPAGLDDFSTGADES
jgi:exodeoxyribonuclease VII small subunit